jgi:hypothetical protein
MLEGGAAVGLPFDFRRLVVRYERRAENYLGFVQFGCLTVVLSYL